MFEKVGLDDSNLENEELVYAIPLILKIRSEGSTFFIKVDGERENNVSTVMVNDGLLGEDYIRCETDDLLKGISQVISEYSERFWN